MSKYTQEKLYRTFNKPKERRKETIPARTRKEVPCPVCEKPCLVSPGQVVYAHKGCKAELKNARRFINRRK